MLRAFWRTPQFARVLLALALVFVVGSCRPKGDNAGGLPRKETVYVGGRQWGQPSTFNPLEGQAAWPVVGFDGSNLMYETLLVFNQLNGKPEPLLAESYKVETDRIDVVLHQADKWSDGKPVTGFDVKYTFDLAQAQQSLPHANVWKYLKEVALPEVAAGGAAHPRQVSFVLDPTTKNPLVVLDQLQQTRIIAKHVFEPELAKANNDMTTFLKNKFDKNPVVSGPYNLHSYSDEKIVTVRRDDYWGNAVFFGGRKPAPKYIAHQIYKSNDHFSVALQQGRLDVSSTFVPRIWLKQKKGVHSWFEKEPYFLASAMTVLFVT